MQTLSNMWRAVHLQGRRSGASDSSETRSRNSSSLSDDDFAEVPKPGKGFVSSNVSRQHRDEGADDEFIVLFDPKEPDPSMDERVYDRFGFPVNKRSAGLYFASQGANEKAVAEQANVWNAFIEKYSSEIEAGASREQILEHAFRKHKSEFLQLVRDGVPTEQRPHVWQITAGTRTRLAANRGLYRRLLDQHAGEKTEHVIQIDKDTHRTFPGHRLFETIHMTATLRRVLVAFSWHNKQIGYCQGLNFIAGLLLLFVQEEECFWLLDYVVNKVAIEYYSDNMLGVEADLRLLRSMLEKNAPAVDTHMKHLECDMSLNCFKWLPCLGVGSFPTELILRVFDLMFSEGIGAVLRVIIALYKHHEAVLRGVNDPMELLRVMNAACTCAFETNKIMKEALALQFPNAADLEQKRQEHRDVVQAKLARDGALHT
eukprot:TRINITY_DN13027_c0_g1_i1.p1 TRINITY_DN13027_c0_g1~~TRINITY_DN13027_c0_g1_i1.p1  ORF type:complete len:429 (-),score=90.85 TRINITY_DN13027_c0_g1_i1:458-1744(-)